MTKNEAVQELTVHLEHWERLKEQNILPCDECNNTIDALRLAIEALSEDIVRCKECKHRYKEDVCPMYYEEWFEIDDDDGFYDSDFIVHDYTLDDGYCDRAERRE